MKINIEEVKKAELNLKKVVEKTPISLCLNLSEEFNSNIYLKREDLQNVRSYKIRGAYNKIFSLNKSQTNKEIVCASAGNHAQGVAYSCFLLKIKAKIYMPATTPKQKVNQVKRLGKEFCEIILIGDTFDDAYQQAFQYSTKNKLEFIHPFNDFKIIEGQGTIALEILDQINTHIDYLFIPIGGGGMASGVASIFKAFSPNTKLIGVEPEGAAAMHHSIKANKLVKLNKIDKFVDGAAIQQVGDLTVDICKNLLDDIILIPEGKVCSTILKLYNENAIVVEPAGALSIAALDLCKEKIKHKNIVCIISGSNNDITRTEEIKERSLLYEGLKHYFIVRFPQRAGALKEFVNQVLTPGDDITHFEYSKKNNKEKGPALIGVEVSIQKNIDSILKNMKLRGFHYEYLNTKEDLLRYLV